MTQEKGHTEQPRLLPGGRQKFPLARVGVTKQMERMEQDLRSTLCRCVKARGTACCDRVQMDRAP